MVVSYLTLLALHWIWILYGSSPLYPLGYCPTESTVYRSLDLPGSLTAYQQPTGLWLPLATATPPATRQAGNLSSANKAYLSLITGLSYLLPICLWSVFLFNGAIRLGSGR